LNPENQIAPAFEKITDDLLGLATLITVSSINEVSTLLGKAISMSAIVAVSAIAPRGSEKRVANCDRRHPQTSATREYPLAIGDICSDSPKQAPFEQIVRYCPAQEAQVAAELVFLAKPSVRPRLKLYASRSRTAYASKNSRMIASSRQSL
jgi:hypothetical protein